MVKKKNNYLGQKLAIGQHLKLSMVEFSKDGGILMQSDLSFQDDIRSLISGQKLYLVLYKEANIMKP